MRKFLSRLLVLAGVLLLPATAFAQASIAGTTKDASGAVLPGVTVEASSPVLIEKVRIDRLGRESIRQSSFVDRQSPPP